VPPARRSPSRRGLHRTARLALLAALAVTVLQDRAQPTTAAASPAQVARVQAQLDRLNEQADVAVEDYLEAQLQLGTTRAQLAQVQAQARDAERHLAGLRAAVAERAALAYKLGPAADLGTLLDAADPASVVRRMESLDVLAERHSDQLVELRAAVALLGARRAAVAAVERRQAEQVARLQAKKAQILRLVARTERLIAQIKASDRRRAEQEAQALAAARAQAAAARAAIARANAAAAARRTAAAQAAAAPRSPGRPSPRPDPPPPPAGDGGAAAAVRFARAQLGKPYQWGADGPAAYDCSGLTMRAWQQGGVSLPHSSRAQFDIGRHLARGELRPGDLIFYHQPISHVAIYVGNGMQIAATHTGSTVKLQPAFQESVAGYTRPTG
jgi:peptidoglycan DL-endopeptidase CwlO